MLKGDLLSRINKNIQILVNILLKILKLSIRLKMHKFSTRLKDYHTEIKNLKDFNNSNPMTSVRTIHLVILQGPKYQSINQYLRIKSEYLGQS